MPRASDSGDSDHTSHNGVPDTAFRQQHGVGITIRPISELIPHGLLTRCVRFAPAGRPTNGNTRYRPARYGFDRAGLAPAGLQQEVSLTHHSSPSSALIPARTASGRLTPVSRLAQIDEIRTNSLGTAKRRAPDTHCAAWILSVPCWPARLSGIPREVFVGLGNVVAPDTLVH